MNAHFPPFDKSPGTVSARSLYDETQVIAERQERDNDALPSILAAMREVVARLERYGERKACTEALKAANAAAMARVSAATKHPPPEWMTSNGELSVEIVHAHRHPMAAESIREQDERLAWMEARL